MSFTNQDLQKLLHVIRRGRDSALTALEIESRIGFQPQGNQVKTRALIGFAIEEGYLIKSSTKSPAGYWLENNEVEIRNYVTSLRKRARKIYKRAARLLENLNNG